MNLNYKQNISTQTTTQNDNGQGLTEYPILVVLISIVSITAVKTLGGTVKDKIEQVNNEISSRVSKIAR